MSFRVEDVVVEPGPAGLGVRCSSSKYAEPEADGVKPVLRT